MITVETSELRLQPLVDKFEKCVLFLVPDVPSCGTGAQVSYVTTVSASIFPWKESILPASQGGATHDAGVRSVKGATALTLSVGLYNEFSLREREVDRIWSFATWPSRESENFRFENFRAPRKIEKVTLRAILFLLGRPPPPASFHP